jgi:4-amino-4-deoxy-L-arabinose transferase-like glycosyltransferase
MSFLAPLNEALSMKTARLEQIDQRGDWYKYLGALLPILTAYLILAFYRIDNQSLWVDEAISAKFSKKPLSTLLWNPHGPLYFILLHFWMKLGSTEFVLRAFSALLGGVSVWLTYEMGFRLFNRRMALVGATLFATSPLLIWYSQEVRYITLMFVTSLLSMLSFYQASSTNRAKWWLVYGTSTILALFTFMSAIFLPPAQGLYLLWSASRRSLLRKWIAWQAIIFAPFLIWFVGAYGHLFAEKPANSNQAIIFAEKPENSNQAVMFNVVKGKIRPSRELSAAVVPYTFFAFSVGFSLGPSVRELHGSRSLATLLDHGSTLLPLMAIFGTLFLFGIITLWQEDKASAFLVSWLVGPIVGTLVLVALTNLSYNVRYAAAALPAYTLILAAAVTAFRRRGVQVALLSTLLFTNGLALAHYYYDPQYAREDSRSAAQYLESMAGPQDMILLVGNKRGLQYYYGGDVPIVQWGRRAANDELAIAERVRKLSEGYNRLWLIEIRPWEVDSKGVAKAVIDRTHTIIRSKHFAGVDVYCYQIARESSSSTP